MTAELLTKDELETLQDMTTDICPECGRLRTVYWEPEAKMFMCAGCSIRLLPLFPPKSEKAVCIICEFDIESDKDLGFDEIHRTAHKRCLEVEAIRKMEGQS